MSRVKRSKIVVENIAARFSKAMQEYLGKSPEEMYLDLGYKNPTTLHYIRNGLALPDFTRIAEHHKALHDGRGMSVNFHWVITGEGEPMINSSKVKVSKKIINQDNDIINKFKTLNPEQRDLIIRLLKELS